MRSKLTNGNWRKKSSTFLALAMVASLAIQPVNVRAAAAKTVTADAITLSVEDDVQVLVVGNSYDLTYVLSPSKSTEKVTFKSSNPAVATVSAKGEIIAVKQGVVSVEVTAESGKKVTKKFWVVTKAYTTAYQSTLNKMLASSNISKVSLKNTKTADKYIIKKADYSSKTLYVNTPNSDVKNFATFKQVNIVDVADNTWFELAKGNSFKITDKKAHFIVADTAQVKSVNVAAANAQVAIDANGSIGTVNVTGDKAEVSVDANNNAVVKILKVTAEDAKVTVVADGSFDKIVLDSKADLVIKGSSDSVAVEVTKNAEGASVETAVPVTATVAAKASFVLDQGAEASELSKANAAVALTVDNNTAAKVVITNQETKATEDVAAGSNTVVTPTPAPTTGGSNTTTPTTPTTQTATVTGVSSNGGKTATYTLPTAVTSLKSATVKVTTTAKTQDYAINGTVLTYVAKLLSNDAFYVDLWNTTNSISKDVLGGKTITATGAGKTKTVTFDGLTLEVTVNSSSVVVKKASSEVTYTLSKSTDGKALTIESNTNANVAGLVSFVVTY